MIDFSKPYRVVKAGNVRFEVDTPDGSVVCNSRKKVKRNSDVLVGDLVYLENADGETVIKAVEKRRNSLIRPAVANVDQIVMLISPVPEPDYFLIDKLILNCHAKKIDCILCVNKTDIRDLTDEIEKQYARSVRAIVPVCAKSGYIEKLLPLLKNRITCLAGQSAVGKSSLCNALTGSDCFEEGELSERIMRGKNTTTVASLVRISDGTFIVDTPGFSMLDVFDVTADELDLYYDEYVELSVGCKYHRCTHVAEPDCEVKRKVASGELSSERYERYKTLYETLKNAKKY
ncbi:MAG: ribosome small subunit-dependent GTPase A [Candidatus Neoclostridium sp.]